MGSPSIFRSKGEEPRAGEPMPPETVACKCSGHLGYRHPGVHEAHEQTGEWCTRRAFSSSTEKSGPMLTLNCTTKIRPWLA